MCRCEQRGERRNLIYDDGFGNYDLECDKENK